MDNRADRDDPGPGGGLKENMRGKKGKNGSGAAEAAAVVAVRGFNWAEAGTGSVFLL